MQTICDDLQAEHVALDVVVAGLDPAQWDLATPAAGWSIRDSISHLWFFDQRARMALDESTRADFLADAQQLLAAVGGGDDPSVSCGRALMPADLLESWRADRARLLDVARAADPSSRIPWYGPAMAARSFVTARLMETWAHGQDVRDALGLPPEASARLVHVAHIGVRARPFAYAINGLELPEHDVFVQLTAPDGQEWTWGDVASPDRVGGSALDFCLVVTQRRNVADTSLEIEGAGAWQWMGIAQAFAGPPGQGRAPLA